MKHFQNMFFLTVMVIMLTAPTWSEKLGLNRKATPIDVVIVLIPFGSALILLFEGYQRYKKNRIVRVSQISQQTLS